MRGNTVFISVGIGLNNRFNSIKINKKNLMILLSIRKSEDYKVDIPAETGLSYSDIHLSIGLDAI